MKSALAAVAARNPRIIYAAAVGFGRQGRYRDRPAFDRVVGISLLSECVLRLRRRVPSMPG